MKKNILFLLLLIAFAGCETDYTGSIIEELKKETVSYQNIQKNIEMGGNIDGVLYKGAPLLIYLMENNYFDIVKTALKQKAKVVFEKKDEFRFINACLAPPSDNLTSNIKKELFDLMTGSEEVKVHMEFLHKTGRMSVGELKPLFDYSLEQKDKEALAFLVDKGYSPKESDIFAAAKFPAIEFLQLAIKNMEFKIKPESIRQKLDFLTRNKFILLYPKINFLSNNQRDDLFQRAISNKQYDIAAYLLNYSSLSATVSMKTALAAMEDYLNKKNYSGDSRAYNNGDLILSPEVDKALSAMGISHYMFLRNEIFARRGYIFKTPVLNTIFQTASWYKQTPNVLMVNMNSFENKNVAFIKNQEDSYDYNQVAAWLNDKPYTGDEDYYFQDSDYRVPSKIMAALNHIGITSSRLLRNEIYARNGYIFKSRELRKIFEGTIWYEGRASHTPQLPKTETVNVMLCKFREWIDMIDFMKQQLPNDVDYIPVVGYNTLFLRKIDHQGVNFHYSTHLMGTANTLTTDIFKDKTIGFEKADDGITTKLRNEIKDEPDAYKALTRYFENKKYKGYTDSYVYTPGDMKAPGYLADAVKKLNVPWTVLLRKEIHARHGAIMTDPVAGKIFRACSWYKGKHNIDLSTLIRLPRAEKVSETEVLNFCLIEGEELYGKKETHKDKVIAVDLNGGTYFIKIGKIIPPQSVRSFYTAYGYTNLNQYNDDSLEDTLNSILSQYDAVLEEVSYEYIYQNWGC